MTTIDHRYYPHIIDLIWVHLDYDGHKAVRSTCKAWKKRADRIEHMWVVQKGNTLEIRKRDSREPDFWTVFRHVSSVPPVDDAYWQRLSWKIKVLDISDEIFDKDLRDWVSQWSTHAMLVRNVGPGGDMMCITPHTHLIFQDVEPNTLIPFWEWVGWYVSQDIIISADCYADPTDAMSGMLSSIVIPDGGEWNRSITFILNDKRPGKKAGRPSVIDYDFILNWVSSVEFVPDLVLVGLELFITDDAERRQFKKELRRVLVDLESGTNAELRERCRFYTHENYKASVGERKYALYTASHQLSANRSWRKC